MGFLPIEVPAADDPTILANWLGERMSLSQFEFVVNEDDEPWILYFTVRGVLLCLMVQQDLFGVTAYSIDLAEESELPDDAEFEHDVVYIVDRLRQ